MGTFRNMVNRLQKEFMTFSHFLKQFKNQDFTNSRILLLRV